MLEQAHSVVVLLTSDYSHHLLVMGLAGGDMDDDVLSAQGATVVRPGVAGLRSPIARYRPPTTS